MHDRVSRGREGGRIRTTLPSATTVRNEEPRRAAPSAGSSSASSPEACVVASASSDSSSIASIGRRCGRRGSEGGAGDGEADPGLPAGETRRETRPWLAGGWSWIPRFRPGKSDRVDRVGDVQRRLFAGLPLQMGLRGEN